MYKKLLSAVLAVVLVCSTMLAGCAQTDTTTTTTQDASATEATTTTGDGTEEHEAVTIRVLTRYTGSDSTTPVFQEMIRTFEEEYPWITIQDDSVNEEAAYNNKLMTSVATGDMPNIFYIPGLMTTKEWAESGVVMDVSSLMEDTEWFEGFNDGSFEPWNFSAFGLDGYYAVPFSVGVESFYYNKDLFAQAGIETPPETLSEFYVAIEKLQAIGVTPIAVGAGETWRAGHILNWLSYKNVGVDKIKEIGARTASWTDPDMIETLELYMDLKERGAFPENYEGLSYDEEKNMFFSGEAAMVLNGSWFIGDCNASDMVDSIGVFNAPYIDEKPEFAGDGSIYPQGFSMDATATGAELEAQILFMKHMTSQDMETLLVEEVQNLSSRSDIPVETMDLSEIYLGVIEIGTMITNSCGDTFDYDPLASMVDRTRNSLIGMSLGMSPEDTAAEIQAEIDKNS